MFRILMLSHYYFPHIGGNEGQCRLLSEELLKRGHQVTVVTKKHSRGLPSFERINGINVFRVFCLGSLFSDNSALYSRRGRMTYLRSFTGRITSRLFFYIDEFFFMLFAGIKICRLREKIDLVHIHQTHWMAYAGVVAARYSKKPVFLKDATLNGFSGLRFMPFSKSMKKTIIKNGWFAAVSAYIYKDLRTEGVPSHRIFRLPNGVVVPLHRNEVHSENREILFVGNYDQGKIKGLDILIQAFANIRARIPSSELIILGKGDIPALRRYISNFNVPPGNVHLFFNRKAYEFYRKCSVFVLPSRSEGMSNSLLEAMSHGMACVSTRVSGSVDIIDNGINGILIDTENPGQMADALALVLSDRELAKELGNNARTTVMNKYRIEMVADMYQEAYRNIILNNVIINK